MRTIGKFKVEYSCRNTINTLKIVTIPSLCILEIFFKRNISVLIMLKRKLSFYILCIVLKIKKILENKTLQIERF